MKYLILSLVLLLAACGRSPVDTQHVNALQRGCVLKERKIVDKACGRRGDCWDITGTVYSCPAFELTIRD